MKRNHISIHVFVILKMHTRHSNTTIKIFKHKQREQDIRAQSSSVPWGIPLHCPSPFKRQVILCDKNIKFSTPF